MFLFVRSLSPSPPMPSPPMPVQPFCAAAFSKNSAVSSVGDLCLVLEFCSLGSLLAGAVSSVVQVGLLVLV